MRRGGIQLQIVTSLLVVMLAALGLVMAVLGAGALRASQEHALERLRMGASWLERALGAGARTSEVAALARAAGPHLVGGEFRLVDPGGRELLSGAAVPRDPAALRARIESAAREGEVVARGPGLWGELWLVRRLSGPDGQVSYLVGHVEPEEMRARVAPLWRASLWVLVIGVVVFMGFGTWLLRRAIVAPLLALRRGTRRIATGDLDAAVAIEGPAEVAELAEYFNEMGQSLARGRRALIDAHRSLARNERLATVGQLAAGVAHEVGNPVTAILAYTDMALRRRTSDERRLELVEHVREEALRIQSLVREMLDLARVDSLVLEPTDLGAVARHTAERLQSQALFAGIALRLELAGWLPTVSADARRVEQILTNLLENAAQALAAGDPPEVVLRSAPLTLRERRGRRLEDGAPDPGPPPLGAALEVTDNGPGISEEHLAHVFDPFFTTKEPGKGTGLGLWNAHRLAELMNGYLEVTSQPGCTCFRLVLPASDTGTGHDPAPDPDHR